MSDSLLLALDTATDVASIALYDGTAVLSELTWHSRRQHTVELMPRIVALMQQAGLSPGDLAGLAVVIGPGSFTGIRVALGVAKGIAGARRLPLFGVSTLDAVAYPHQAQPLPVVALVQAGRGRVCWARYGRAPQTPGWSEIGPYRIDEVAGVAQTLTGPLLFAGELLPETRARLADGLADTATFAPPALALRRAAYAAELAWPRLLAGQADDLTTLSPIYLHELPPAQVS